MDAPPDIVPFDPFAGSPRLHGATRIGIRPGTEILHPLAATGQRPLRFEGRGIPEGIRIDEDGILRGRAPNRPGSHRITVTVSNSINAATATVELVVGDTLALTPPMGWNSWNMHADTVDADVVLAAARALVDTGLRDLGYQYVNIDDHWHAPERAPDGTPMADPSRFPDGIEGVAARVHELGLKLGLYSDAAHLTCGGCYGSHGHEVIDARTYASWGVDYLKYDYCHAPWSTQEAKRRYRAMAEQLEHSGRSIVFSVCEWGFRRPWRWAPGIGASLWRTTPDVHDTFGGHPYGIRSIARRNLALAAHAGPGRWNDPDMLVVGNRGRGRATGVLRAPGQLPGWIAGRSLRRFRGLTDVEAHTHMSLWAMMAAPLLASHDPANSSEFDLALLRNPEILAIDQDPIGAPGRRVPTSPGFWKIVKPLVDGGLAVAVVNPGRRTRRITIDLEALITGPRTPRRATSDHEVMNAWTHERLGSPSTLRAELPAHGSAVWVCRPTEPTRSGDPVPRRT